MTSFGKRKDSRTGASSGEGRDKARSGKKDYKAGRSFSKNKAGRASGKGKFEKDSERKTYSKRSESGEQAPKRSFDRERKSFGGERDKPFRKESGERPRSGRSSSYGERKEGERPSRFGKGEARGERSFGGKRGSDRGAFGREKSYGEKKERSFSKDERGERKPFRENSREEKGEKRFERSERPARRNFDDKPFRAKSGDDRGKREFERSERPARRSFDEAPKKRRSFGDKEERPSKSPVKKNDDGLIRLNKYLANAGIASRREADILIQSGSVRVNGEVVDQLGFKIKPGDKVTYGDAAVKAERKVYMVINKPKDYITTVDDPRERRTVMDLIAGACRERVYPVGRLDRNTTGVLLMTNDGELTTRLTHPKFGIKKIYHVSLNKGLRADDFKKIIEGIELEDGMIAVDDLAFTGEGKKEIGLEIHSGRNRIVRRIFEHLGYDVLKLDRVSFAGLTKKDLPRGKYRFLTEKEISFLKMIG